MRNGSMIVRYGTVVVCRAMCARCVAEGAAYVVPAVGGLRLWARRLRFRRARAG
jgi:hypothetical protein